MLCMALDHNPTGTQRPPPTTPCTIPTPRSQPIPCPYQLYPCQLITRCATISDPNLASCYVNASTTATATGRRKLDSSGCLDPKSSNHEPSGGLTNCEYEVAGCMDSFGQNYLVAANSGTQDDCEYARYGCTIADGTLNYDSTANVLQGCVNVQPGCTESFADNYVSSANTDDGSCRYDVHGCSAAR